MSPTCTADEGVVLSIGDVPPDGASPALPIRWCVSTKAIEQLERCDVKNAYLLVVVCVDNGPQADTRYREVDRKLFKLRAMMGWLQFNRAGAHALFARVVWNNDDAYPQRYLRKISRTEYEEEMISYYSGRFHHSPADLVAQPLGITIDSHFFAPAPAAWEQWWVNLWFSYPPEDQCAFRKRRILAYTIQPWLVLVYVLGMAFVRSLRAAWYGLFAIRGVKLAPIFHPFQMRAKDIDRTVDCYERIDSVTVWRRRLTCTTITQGHEHLTKSCYTYEARPFWFAWSFLTPIWLIIFGIAGYCVFRDWTLAAESMVAGSSVMAVGVTVIGLLALGVAFVAVGLAKLVALIWKRAIWPVLRFFGRPPARLLGRWLGLARRAIGKRLGAIFVSIDSWCVRKLHEMEARAKAKRYAKNHPPAKVVPAAPVVSTAKKAVPEVSFIRRDLAPVICTGGPIKVDLKALPKDRQTFTLKFNALKAELCRPFQKG